MTRFHKTLHMKTKHTISILTLILITLALSACSGRTMVASGWAGVTADQDTAYLAFNNHVYAVDINTGIERWRYPQETDTKITFYASPALTDDGQLIVGSYNNVLYSLNPQNGQVNWSFEEAKGRYIGAPLVTLTGIFAPSADNNLYALDFHGNQIWGPFATEEPIWAQPATDDQCECIYIASMDHKIYALDSANGDLKWKTDDLGGSIVSTPALSDDRHLYVGTFANEMLAIDASNGNILWRFTTQDWAWAGPAIKDDTLYFGDLSGTFYALDRNNGQQRWQIQPGGSIVGRPLITEEGIYFTTEDGSLISTDSDGAIRWNQSFEGNMYAGPVKNGDLILVPTTELDALLIAFDSNGVQRWSFEPKEEK
jgi:outer membrane protein assembly factor BamB